MAIFVLATSDDRRAEVVRDHARDAISDGLSLYLRPRGPEPRPRDTAPSSSHVVNGLTFNVFEVKRLPAWADNFGGRYIWSHPIVIFDVEVLNQTGTDRDFTSPLLRLRKPSGEIVSGVLGLEKADGGRPLKPGRFTAFEIVFPVAEMSELFTLIYINPDGTQISILESTYSDR